MTSAKAPYSGYCLMIGGEREPVTRLDPIFRTIAPGTGIAEPTPSRHANGSAPEGYLHCGPSGAGHFVKMVHNGVEYGMMAVIAEGLSIIEHADAGLRKRAADAARYRRRLVRRVPLDRRCGRTGDRRRPRARRGAAAFMGQVR
ncbi:hypothetical protein ACFV27_06850 [Streptomyces antimycoticus]|uniref:hypothetical protein n=1 Tax=Streptomyces antimycoticus TaxID=68175 RepID=UPI0036CD0C0C